MKAAVLHNADSVPVYEDFDEPWPPRTVRSWT